MPKEPNITFSVPELGSRDAYCYSYSEGIKAVGQESHGRTTNEYYSHHPTQQSLILALGFTNYDEWQGFNLWLYSYAAKLSDPDGSKVSGMSIVMPARQRFWVVVPMGGINFGDKAGQIHYRNSISFEVIEGDWKTPGDSTVSAEPKLPNDLVFQAFYPTGVQADANTRKEDLLYTSRNRLPTTIGDLAANATALANPARQVNGFSGRF